MWTIGVVYMEYVEDGNHTLTMHRCWNADAFKKARRDQANAAITKGKPSAVRFLTEKEYKEKGGK